MFCCSQRNKKRYKAFNDEKVLYLPANSTRENDSCHFLLTVAARAFKINGLEKDYSLSLGSPPHPCVFDLCSDLPCITEGSDHISQAMSHTMGLSVVER